MILIDKQHKHYILHYYQYHNFGVSELGDMIYSKVNYLCITSSFIFLYSRYGIKR